MAATVGRSTGLVMMFATAATTGSPSSVSAASLLYIAQPLPQWRASPGRPGPLQQQPPQGKVKIEGIPTCTPHFRILLLLLLLSSDKRSHHPKGHYYARSQHSAFVLRTHWSWTFLTLTGFRLENNFHLCTYQPGKHRTTLRRRRSTNDSTKKSTLPCPDRSYTGLLADSSD